MAADVATLSLKLDAAQFTDGMARARAATTGLSQAETELIAKTDKLVAAGQAVDIQNKKAVQSYLQQIAQLRATAQGMGALNLIEQQTAQSAAEVASHHAAVTAQLQQLNAVARAAVVEQKALGAATGLSDAGLRTLRSSLTSTAASLLGTAPGVAQFTGALGTMALGSGVMIGALAGLAAISFAWEKITESSRKAAKAQDDAIERMDKLRAREKQGVGGQDVDDLKALEQRIADDKQRVKDLQSQSTFGFGAGKGVEDTGAIAAAKERAKEIADLQDNIARGEARVAAAVAGAGQQVVQTTTSNLARIVAAHSATAAEIKNAEGLLKGFKQSLAGLSGDGSANAKRAELIAQIKELDDALHPKDKSSSREAGQARTIANIAEQEERRVAAAKALDAAAQSGQAAYDREVKSQALQNQLLETEQRIRAQFLDQTGKQRAGTEAAMRAEIERAQEAIRAQDELGQHARAALAIQNDEHTLDVLAAKTDAYRTVGASVKDATIEEEYAVRVSEAMAVADDAQRAKKLALADAIRQQQYALNGAADAAEKQRRAEQDAERDMERRARELHRTISSAVEGILTDISNQRNPFVALFEHLKQAALHALAEAFATKVEEKVASILGIQLPATKQEKAAIVMQAAADKQLQAAQIMAGQTPSGGSPIAPNFPSTTPKDGSVAAQRYLRQFLKIGGAAYGGFEIGQGIGQATGDKAAGAIGGAVSGAVLGGQVAGAPGAIAGGIAGFIGGVLGAGNAAKEAAAKLEAARISFKNSWDAIVAEINGDDLAQAIANADQRFQQLKQQFADTLSVSDILNGKFKKGLEEINALEDQYLAKLKQEAAAKAHYFDESLDVRILRAQGKTKEADALDLRNRQEQERDEFKRTHKLVDDPNTTADDAEVAQNIAAYNKLLYAQSLELTANTKAIEENTRVHNSPTGFKVEPFVYQFATPAKRPPISTAPNGPRVNPIPTAGASLSKAPVTVTNNWYIDGTKGTREMVKQIAVVLRQITTETLGKDADIADAWGELA
jgi:colicin import membrane protein